jgi:hypothetical protein
LKSALECLGDGLRHLLEAEGEQAGADQRLRRLGQRPLATEQDLGRDAGLHVLRLARAQHLRHAQLATDFGTGGAAHRLVVDLGQAAGVDLGEAVDQVAGDGERQHAVAEVGEPLVGLGTVLGPGGMGQRLLA